MSNTISNITDNHIAEAKRLIEVYLNCTIEVFKKENEHWTPQIMKYEFGCYKQNALICCNEIIKIFDDTNGSDYREEYWKSVKQAIKNATHVNS